MRICPHCACRIPEDEKRCPCCGAQYWESKSVSGDVETEREEEGQGCFSLIALHFLLALSIFVLLILIGFVINLFIHFEENQVKVAWIGIALLLAGALSAFICNMRKTKNRASKKNER